MMMMIVLTMIMISHETCRTTIIRPKRHHQAMSVRVIFEKELNADSDGAGTSAGVRRGAYG